jgi:hypothetical protein
MDANLGSGASSCPSHMRAASFLCRIACGMWCCAVLWRIRLVVCMFGPARWTRADKRSGIPGLAILDGTVTSRGLAALEYMRRLSSLRLSRNHPPLSGLIHRLLVVFCLCRVCSSSFPDLATGFARLISRLRPRPMCDFSHSALALVMTVR